MVAINCLIWQTRKVDHAGKNMLCVFYKLTTFISIVQAVELPTPPKNAKALIQRIVW